MLTPDRTSHLAYKMFIQFEVIFVTGREKWENEEDEEEDNIAFKKTAYRTLTETFSQILYLIVLSLLT